MVSGVPPPPVTGVEGLRAPPKERSAEVTSPLLIAEVTDIIKKRVSISKLSGNTTQHDLY